MLFYKLNSTIKIHKEIVLFFNPAICSLKKKKTTVQVREQKERNGKYIPHSYILKIFNYTYN